VEEHRDADRHTQNNLEIGLLRPDCNERAAYTIVSAIAVLLEMLRLRSVIDIILLADALDAPAPAAVTDRLGRADKGAPDLAPLALPAALGALAHFPSLELPWLDSIGAVVGFHQQ
jgi:hypothetical protein